MRRVHHALADIRVESFPKIRLRNAHAQTIKPRFFRQNRHRRGDARRIHLIFTHQCGSDGSCVPRVNRQRADLIQRRRIGQQAVTGNRAIRRLDAVTPQKDAGWRIDPPVSLPSA